MSADTTKPTEADGRHWSITINDDGTVTAAFDAHAYTTTPRLEAEIAEAARPVHYREAANSLDHIHPEAARLLRSVAKDLEEGEPDE